MAVLLLVGIAAASTTATASASTSTPSSTTTATFVASAPSSARSAARLFVGAGSAGLAAHGDDAIEHVASGKWIERSREKMSTATLLLYVATYYVVLLRSNSHS